MSTSDITATVDMLDASVRQKLLRTEYWTLIPVELISDIDARKVAHRLNALGSLYYFSKVILRKHRFTDELHLPLCLQLESYHLKECIEYPRDHFKSTVASECAPMWWALPFTDKDEMYMRQIGYGDEWIRWMRRAHNQNTRTLLVSENITNAKKLMSRISLQYQNNSFFRDIFEEILPSEKCKWTEESMTHLRTEDSTPQGEGTYDCLGVGGALQSRHYDRIVQDDLVGRKAIDSEAIMESTIQYHQLLVGAFDSSSINAVEDNDEIVIGNRWSERDLAQWIRDTEPYFNFHTHSAMGGCCSAHPAGHVIFPEEFSTEKLMRWKARLGTYLFSCQFLNNPTAAGNTRWKEEYLNYYSFDFINPKIVNGEMIDKRVQIVHETKQGQVIKDILPRNLRITMTVDPNHSENKGRCRHAIMVTGISSNPQRVYVLDVWAESSSYDSLVQNIFKLCDKWKLTEFWLETIAAQKLLKFHIDYRCKVEGRRLKVNQLKSDYGENAKKRRIDSLDPLIENGQLWIRRNAHLDLTVEFLKYPYGKTLDILDTLAYAPQTWGIVTSVDDVKNFINKQKSQFQQRSLTYV